MEEDIKILEEILQTKEYGLCEITDTFYKAIENLIARYKDKNNSYHIGFIDGGIAKKYEWQDKIKDKIEAIKNRRIEEGECELALHGFLREAKIEALQELLESED